MTYCSNMPYNNRTSIIIMTIGHCMYHCTVCIHVHMIIVHCTCTGMSMFMYIYTHVCSLSNSKVQNPMKSRVEEGKM